MPSVPAWVFTLVAFAATTALNLAGVAVAARAGFVVLVAEIGVLGLFIVVRARGAGQRWPGTTVDSPLTGLGSFAWSPVVGAVSIAVLSFLGFDAIAGFAEENAGDPRDVGRAILLCLAVAGVTFVAQTWLAALLAGAGPGELAARPERQGTAFYDITRAAIAPWLAQRARQSPRPSARRSRR